VTSTVKSWLPKTLKLYLKASPLNFYRVLSLNFIAQFRAPKFFGQTAEDAILCRLLPQKKGIYIDVGAGTPILTSNTYLFYKRGWSGYLVDPIKNNAKLSRILRPRDFIIEGIVSSTLGPYEFWEFDPYEYSTMTIDVAQKVAKKEGVRLVSKRELTGIPLSKLVGEIPKGVPTLLSIDVEGADLDVLKSNDWNVFRPYVICIEEWKSTLADRTHTDIEAFLTYHGYVKVAWTGLSTIFAAEEYPKRLSY
jgi:FkbM family methyltransferase